MDSLVFQSLLRPYTTWQNRYNAEMAEQKKKTLFSVHIAMYNVLGGTQAPRTLNINEYKKRTSLKNIENFAQKVNMVANTCDINHMTINLHIATTPK